MAINAKNLVAENVNVIGVGNISLFGALSEGRPFQSAYVDGETDIPVKIEELDSSRNVKWWEYVMCTYNATLNQLVRNTVILSSNNNLPVVFQSGYKRAFVFIPAEAISGILPAVQYVSQTLTNNQKIQARININAAEKLIPFLFPGALMTWTIVHNLGRPLPPFRVLNSDGQQLIVSAEDQPGFNQTVINFSTPQSGGIYFN